METEKETETEIDTTREIGTERIFNVKQHAVIY